MREYQIIKTIKEIVDSRLNLIGDDTAVINDSGLVLTCDTLVEDVHFRLSTTTAYDLGYKAGAVNLSDIAASGGVCNYFLVALSIPKNTPDSFIRELFTGLNDIAIKYDTAIVGGDLTYSEKIIITVTAIGKTNVKTGRAYARAGQKLLTTGDYGSSYTGLKYLEARKNEKLFELPQISDIEFNEITRRHTRPEPRLKEAQFIINNLNYTDYCMMDTSDGLADAVLQISQKSSKRLNIYTEKIPISSKVRYITQKLNIAPEEVALYGAEDFELLFCCNSEDMHKLIQLSNFTINEIGDIFEDEPGVNLVYNDKQMELTEEILADRISFKHF